MLADNADPPNRRSFFREALTRAVEPLADYIDQRFDLRAPRPRLRPPGAIEEARFVDACQRCGACVETCPANAIFPLDDTAGGASGTPIIDPDKAACVVCDGLLCTHVCPSGALLPLNAPYLISMGVAEVYDPLCVRSNGEACTICSDQCPIGRHVILFPDSGPPTVNAPDCVGCGICQLYCPTTPKAIVIKPT